MKPAIHFAALFVALAAIGSPAQAQDAKAGESKAAMCIGCHGIPGYQASFPEIHKVPMIAGQNGKYIVAALDAYRKGDRKHPSMRGIAGSLTDQDIADLAAYYEARGKSGEVAAAAAPAPDALKDRLQVCVACHGPNFNSTTDPANPRLAGQHADYLYVALKSYLTDGNPQVGRANATMKGMLATEAEGKKKTTFTNAELKQLAAYLSGLPGQLTTPKANTFR
jgi:cytochrome c553